MSLRLNPACLTGAAIRRRAAGRNLRTTAARGPTDTRGGRAAATPKESRTANDTERMREEPVHLRKCTRLG